MLTLTGAKREITGLAFAPDGRTLAATGWHTGRAIDRLAGHVELWPLPAGGEPVVWLAGCFDTANPRFSPDGRTLYCRTFSHPQSDSDPLAVRDVRTGADRPSPTDREREILTGFDLSPDGTRLVTASTRWHHLADNGGAYASTRTFDGSPDRTGYARKTDGTLVQTWAVVPDEHTFSVTCLPDRFVAVTNRLEPDIGDNVRELVRCDLATGREQQRGLIDLPPDTAPLVASPDGAWLAGIARARYRLLVADAATLETVAVVPNPQGQRPFTGVAFTPDGKHLLAAGSNGFVRAFAMDDWKCVKTWDWKAGHLTCVAVSPNGTLAAAGTKTGTVVVWDLDM